MSYHFLQEQKEDVQHSIITDLQVTGRLCVCVAASKTADTSVSSSSIHFTVSDPSFLPPLAERERADAPASGRLLPEGRLPAPPPAAEADVRDQLHGDGQGDGRAPHLPALQGAADQGRLPAAAAGETADRAEWIPTAWILDSKRPVFVFRR